MIDRNARKRTSDVLKKLALGKMTSYECENELLGLYPNSNDPAIFAIYRTVFEMGGENDKPLAHLFVRGGEMRKRICRWIYFLKTDLEYEWPKEQLAPGIRDFYKPNLLDKFFGLNSRITLSKKKYISRGDYQVWPFFRRADLEATKEICRDRLLSQVAK